MNVCSCCGAMAIKKADRVQYHSIIFGENLSESELKDSVRKPELEPGMSEYTKNQLKIPHTYFAIPLPDNTTLPVLCQLAPEK